MELGYFWYLFIFKHSSFTQHGYMVKRLKLPSSEKLSKIKKDSENYKEEIDGEGS